MLYPPYCGWPYVPLVIADKDLSISSIINSSSIPGPAGPPGPQGEVGPQGNTGPQSELLFPVTTVENDYTALPSDFFIGVITGGGYTISLPISTEGTIYIVKDVFGDAETNPITIAHTGLIDGAASAIINTNFGSLTFIYNNGSWSIV